MDAALKELTKLEKYTDSNSRDSSIHHALDSLLQALQDGKAALLAGQSSEDCLEQLATAVEVKKKEIDERQKELYTVLSRLGKALDKVFHEIITCGILALTPWNIVLEISNTATILP
jgi:DNA repair exonuclease SbcCD ATPase subunit